MIKSFEAFLLRHKQNNFINMEFLSYNFWGCITTILNIGIFQLLFILGMDYRISNVIALVITKIAAYVVNKIFVFRSHCENTIDLLKEIFRYTTTRGFTMLIDYFGLVFLTTVLMINPQSGKFITTIIVAILNYTFGKFLVFQHKTQQQ